jgi:hypothetical protein
MGSRDPERSVCEEKKVGREKRGGRVYNAIIGLTKVREISRERRRQID